MSNAVYELVTNLILKKMSEGHIPWKRPWVAQMPQNISGHEYQGINQILLGLEPFKSPFWLTYRQISERGGHVIKGQKSSIAVFWKMFPAKDIDSSGDQQEKTIPLLRYYKLFNLEQTENVKLEPKIQAQIERMENPKPFDPIAKAEVIWENFKDHPVLEHGHSRAFYRPSTDTIYLPHRYAFDNATSYHATLAHEAIHSTAHESRLNRKLGNRFGSKEYALEELIAELGSAFLLAKAGLDPEPLADQQAAYIENWSRKLKADPKLFVTASSKGAKAANYILGVTATGEVEPEGEMVA